ncbi:unnamed protein product [marine sediment metagenome]|uniref:Uncharacterized protein n=1 Tax=marine sediment metagenome TaxID=412755 RepID=X0TW65_9ZZZZ
MGLRFSLSALIATIALVLIGGAIYNKAKEKKDSPLYRIANKFKRKKTDEMVNQEVHYKRLSHRGGIKL